jgi:hypothetical protein
LSDYWDWEHQKAETEATVALLREEGAVAEGALIVLDLEFVPAFADADRAALVKSLKSFGYEVTSDADDGGVEISVPDVAFGVESIWLHEERTTKLALARGFEPDGWGFFEP